MRIYRLADGVNADGRPFLFEGHAYLPDGTPLTVTDRHGRIVPAREAPAISKVTCAGGQLSLARRHGGIEALARALDARDFVRAPLVLLHLQIDPTEAVAKFNPFHKPPGPGGGQFTNGPEAGSSPLGRPRIQEVAQDLHVSLTSGYREGIPGNEDIDAAHKIVTLLIYKAILTVSNLGFRPGMPGYGIKFHDEVAKGIIALGDPNFHAEQIYSENDPLRGAVGPLGSVRPDFVYVPLTNPRAVFELKTGSAADTSDTAVVEQRERTLRNMPGQPVYDYFLVRER